MGAGSWAVHKFGGTCVASAERYRAAARLLVAAGDDGQLVVVSAMAGVTDALLATLDQARGGTAPPDAGLEPLAARHLEAAAALLPETARVAFAAALHGDLDAIRDLLRAVARARSVSDSWLELVSGYGELWSARLLQAHLESSGVACDWLDARSLLVVEKSETGARVDWETSRTRFDAWFAAHPGRLHVVTGYIASTRDGVPTTLGRNGSDFSAAIFAALVGAGSITIWTDVDGVLTADPRRVPEAVLVARLSYEEAAELAYFGASVLHPHTMAPAIAQGIPIRIRNAFRPEAPGTLIAAADAATGAVAAGAVSGLSSVEDVCLLDVRGTGMIGVPGVAQRLFAALRDVGVSVILISQASSEHSICCAVPATQAARARGAVEAAFFAEIHAGLVQTVALSEPCSILAAVGDRMVETPGVAARFFAALAKAGVNVRAIAQGSSERNISAVVAARDSTRALRAAHAGFYLAHRTLSLGLVGAGSIGGTFLDQLADQAETLRGQFGIDLRVRAIADSRRMWLDDRGIDLQAWRSAFAAHAIDLDLEVLAAHVQAAHLPHAVLLDCTASESVAAHYRDWLGRGIHVITPNKKANSGHLEAYRELRTLGGKPHTHYLYEATVGAGLPVITTLRDLVQTGDRVLRIEGVLSGTLSYLFNTFDGSRPFSSVVREARERGYTEPDPRDDLSGMDVARKLVILGREMGLGLGLESLPVESLVPEALRDAADPDAFLAGLEAHDAAMAERLQRARAAGRVLRHVGVVDPDGGSAVAVREYDAAHPFAGLRGTENVFLFRTRRYSELPLVVRGPGAGPAVTAGGVFADLLRLAAYLGGGA